MRSKTSWMLLLAAAVACASSGVSPSTPEAGRPPAARRDRALITMEDLADPSMSALSVYEAIRLLRPNFLSDRGTQMISYEGSAGTVDAESGRVHASIDGLGIVSVEELKRLHVNGVLEIRLLDAAAAMLRFGATARQGPVILVRTM